MQKTKQHALLHLLKHVQSELEDTQALITLLGPTTFYSAPHPQLHYLMTYTKEAIEKNPNLECSVTISVMNNPENPHLKTISIVHCSAAGIKSIPLKELRKKLPKRPDYQVVNLKEILPKWRSK